MAKRNGNMRFEDFVQTRQPDVPDNATRVMNPLGCVVQTPSGTMIGGIDQPLMSTAGGDGRQYNWGLQASGPWNNNPMPQTPDPYTSSQPFQAGGRSGRRK